MLATMLRRGPDGNGAYTSDNCALLHTRLAIIDPENGAQPMKLCWLFRIVSGKAALALVQADCAQHSRLCCQAPYREFCQV